MYNNNKYSYQIEKKLCLYNIREIKFQIIFNIRLTFLI